MPPPAELREGPLWNRLALGGAFALGAVACAADPRALSKAQSIALAVICATLAILLLITALGPGRHRLKLSDDSVEVYTLLGRQHVRFDDVMRVQNAYKGGMWLRGLPESGDEAIELVTRDRRIVTLTVRWQEEHADVIAAIVARARDCAARNRKPAPDSTERRVE